MITKISANTQSRNSYKDYNNKISKSPAFSGKIGVGTQDLNLIKVWQDISHMVLSGLSAKNVPASAAALKSEKGAISEISFPQEFNVEAKKVYTELKADLGEKGMEKISFLYAE